MTTLGLKTELMFHRHNGVVEERADYQLVRTPSNPTYFYGNLLVFKNAPQSGDLERWTKLYENEFAKIEGIEHQTFLWGTGTPEPAELERFKATGFEYSETVVLVAEAITIQHPNTNFEFRRIETPEEWQQVIELHVEVSRDEFRPELYRSFAKKRYDNYRRLQESGMGAWYGAFDGNLLVSDLGLYQEDGVARFQNIETHPFYRRQGICQSLIRHAALDSGGRFFVMQAEEDGPAIAMYKRIGFEPREIIAGLCLYDRSAWKTG
ncbi:MAG TPA: GNAT family N-acetyltransferase [Bdellovibrionota bacterium]|jgi:ribosomal protein S18 acetylase RimI-like enzyme|nr:GNAT family N-acetyltransferase [Bdellovibrionota bacterium]